MKWIKIRAPHQLAGIPQKDNATTDKMAAMENENDNTADWKLRVNPSLLDVTEKHSNRMLVILVANKD